LIPFALVALLFAAANALYPAADSQLFQISPRQLVDGIVDWADAGIDSFGPIAAEGPQHVMIIDGFVDWINWMVDGSPPSTAKQDKSLPSA